MIAPQNVIYAVCNGDIQHRRDTYTIGDMMDIHLMYKMLGWEKQQDTYVFKRCGSEPIDFREHDDNERW